MKVNLTEAAEADLEEIADWIAEDNPARAISFIAELLDRCMSLATRPRRFPIARRSGGAEFRKLAYKNYLIFYVIFIDHVEIVHVLHGSRDWKALLDQS